MKPEETCTIVFMCFDFDRDEHHVKKFDYIVQWKMSKDGCMEG
jgi:hypothetical protein